MVGFGTWTFWLMRSLKPRRRFRDKDNFMNTHWGPGERTRGQWMLFCGTRSKHHSDLAGRMSRNFGSAFEAKALENAQKSRSKPNPPRPASPKREAPCCANLRREPASKLYARDTVPIDLLARAGVMLCDALICRKAQTLSRRGLVGPRWHTTCA